MVNRDNHFYGDDEADVIVNHHIGGSKLAQVTSLGDLLYGGGGIDKITGNSRVDILLGGDDTDHLYGEGGEDVLAGNEGNDHLYGGAQRDIMSGGIGFDTYDIKDHDTILDTDGQGKLLFDTEVPQYFIAAAPGITDSWVSSDFSGEQDGKFTARRIGEDLHVTEQANTDNKAIIKNYFLHPEAMKGALLLRVVEGKYGEAKEYTITPNSPSVHNEYHLGPDSYRVDGNPLNDLIHANSARPGKTGLGLVTNTGMGTDTVFGSFYPDIIEGGGDTDVLFGSANPGGRKDEQKALDIDRIAGGDGADFIFGQAGKDYLHGGNPNEHEITQTRDAQGDWVNGGEGDDHIFGSAAHDVLQGGAGGDDIRGGAGNDLLVGDSDVVIYSRISDWTGNYRPLTYRHTYNWDKSEFNPVLRLGRFNHVVKESDKWTLAIDHDKHSYHITRNYRDWQNQPFTADAQGGADYLDGGAGNDMLLGQLGNDHLRGGLGNDILKGGEGADSYYFYQEDLQNDSTDILLDDGQGDGTNRDVIVLDGHALQQFSWGYDPEQKIYLNALGWTMHKEGNELLIGHKDKSNLIRVKDYANGDFSIAFDETPEDPTPEDPQNPKPPASGTPLAAQHIDEKQPLSYTVPDNAFQSGQDDPLSYSAQLADGKPLPGWLAFDAATRTFSGTPGNDDVGTLSIDIHAKGKGGTASQRLTLNIANVNDAPQAGEALADVQAERSKPLTHALPANAFVDIDKGDTLTLSATLDNGDPLPAWLSFDANDGRFAGIPPADAQALYRIAVSATDKAGARIAQTFALNINKEQPNIIHSNGVEKILQGTAGNDKIHGGDHILPGSHKEIHGLDGDDELFSGKGGSILYGGAGNDILHASDRDSLHGGHGDDIYRIGRDFMHIAIKNYDLKHYDYRAERFDIIELPAHQRDGFVLHRHGDNLYLTGKNGQQISIFDQFSNQGNNRHYIHEIRFADTTLTMADIKALLQNGTPGDDTLHAQPEGETLYAGDGNDQIFGHQGNDRLYGENGNDILRGGAGDDQLSGENGNDELHGEDGKDSLDGGHGDDILHGGADDDRLFGNTGHDKLHGGAGNDKLDGSLGDDWLWGDDGDDDLFGSTGNDVLNGGRGNDKLSGYEGNDIYQFDGDFGQDIIQNQSNHNMKPGSQYDRIDFLDLTLADLVWQKAGHNLIITSKKHVHNRVTVLDHFRDKGNTAARIDEIRLADGTTLDYDAINRLVQAGRALPRNAHSTTAQQAQQMTQAMATFNSAQPLDALAVPDIRQPLLAVHGG